MNYTKFQSDIEKNKEEINFSNLEIIFKDLKNIFDKKGFIINWKEIKKQDLHNTINTLSMASPISLEEKQTLLESASINERKINSKNFKNLFN